MAPLIAATVTARRRRESEASDRPISVEGHRRAQHISDEYDAALIRTATKGLCWAVVLAAAVIWITW